MKNKKSIYWILFLLTAMFLGPIMLEERGDMTLKPQRPPRAFIEAEGLRDALGPIPSKSSSTASAAYAPLDNR